MDRHPVLAPGNSAYYSAGAGYGGRGGNSAYTTGGPTYGVGRWSPAILVVVEAMVPMVVEAADAFGWPSLTRWSVDGIISANGNAPSHLGGGGSGGSVFLIVGSLSGTGSVTANGGNAANGSCGGGGGGRIAVHTADLQIGHGAACGCWRQRLPGW